MGILDRKGRKGFDLKCLWEAPMDLPNQVGMYDTQKHVWQIPTNEILLQWIFRIS